MHIYVYSLAAGAKHLQQNAAYLAFKQGLHLIKKKKKSSFLQNKFDNDFDFYVLYSMPKNSKEFLSNLLPKHHFK